MPSIARAVERADGVATFGTRAVAVDDHAVVGVQVGDAEVAVGDAGEDLAHPVGAPDVEDQPTGSLTLTAPGPRWCAAPVR